MPPLKKRPDHIQEELAQVTRATLKWTRSNILVSDYGTMQPMLEHALTSVVPASDRAILVKYGCELMGKDWRKALPGMAAFEFQNINLLVTDDYFDERKTTRMGKDPISTKWGPKAAIALGFILKSLSNECLVHGWKKSREWDLAAAIETIEWASKLQYYSQFLEDDLCAKPLAKVTLEDYDNLIRVATASGIAGAIELGCIIGGCDSRVRKQARAFGMSLGCLLQIRDDCIDYIYDESLIHKGAFSDLFTKRRRLPILSAYWCGSRSDQRLIEGVLEKSVIGLKDAAQIVELLLAPKVREAIALRTAPYKKNAIGLLAQLPGASMHKEHIQDLILLFTDL
jgi:geranylgeranyl pyrophosphate synthase